MAPALTAPPRVRFAILRNPGLLTFAAVLAALAQNPRDIEAAMSTAFQNVHQAFSHSPKPQGGCTALVVLTVGARVVVAN